MVFAPLAGALIGRVHAGLLGGIGMGLFALGLFSLAWLPAAPSDGEIIWRMMLCGAGFGLFQSPNNHTIITSAPRNRSGGASGMLGTARLFGQTTGAALVALMFNMFYVWRQRHSRLAGAGGYFRRRRRAGQFAAYDASEPAASGGEISAAPMAQGKMAAPGKKEPLVTGGCGCLPRQGAATATGQRRV